jgi:hypothetical protein
VANGNAGETMKKEMKIVLLGLVLCGAGMPARGEEITEVELRLIHALGEGTSAAQGAGASLLVDLARAGDRWERVWAISSDESRLSPASGRVNTAELTETRVAFDLAMQLKGVSRIQVDLKRDAEGRLDGAYYYYATKALKYFA